MSKRGRLNFQLNGRSKAARCSEVSAQHEQASLESPRKSQTISDLFEMKWPRHRSSHLGKRLIV